MKISRNHKNRKAHNWLVYDIVDAFLKKNVDLYNGIIYDLGAGEATYKDFFLQYGDEYISVDWLNSLHDKRADIVADLNLPLPVESEVADLVISLSVMEHLCEPQTMLDEAHRILKPGGSIVVQVPWQWWIHEAPFDFFRYTPYGLNYLFEKAGFVDIVVTAQSGFFTTLVLKFNYFTRRFVCGPAYIKVPLVLLLLPFWTLGQLLSPFLDQLDRNWSLESCGYYVIAKKASR